MFMSCPKHICILFDYVFVVDCKNLYENVMKKQTMTNIVIIMYDPFAMAASHIIAAGERTLL